MTKIFYVSIDDAGRELLQDPQRRTPNINRFKSSGRVYPRN
jgi:hypothetical protein